MFRFSNTGRHQTNLAVYNKKTQIQSLPDILFTEHWLFFLFLFGTSGHLEGQEERPRVKEIFFTNSTLLSEMAAPLFFIEERDIHKTD